MVGEQRKDAQALADKAAEVLRERAAQPDPQLMAQREGAEEMTITPNAVHEAFRLKDGLAGHDLLAESANKSERGRPSAPDAEYKVAQRIGVPRETVRDARQHVAAVASYPDLADKPQSVAIQEAKAMDAVRQVQALAEKAEPQPTKSEAMKGNQNASNEYSVNNTNTVARTIPDSTYLTRRIARDRPDILGRMKAGEYRGGVQQFNANREEIYPPPPENSDKRAA